MYFASPEIYSNNAMSDEGVKATEHFPLVIPSRQAKL